MILIAGVLLTAAMSIARLASGLHCITASDVSQLNSAFASTGDATRSFTFVPPLPASFYGTVTVNGADAPEGTPVSAWIDGVRYASTDTFTFDGRSMYALDVPADDPATPEVDGGRPGDTVVFRVGGLKADQAAVWQGGTNTGLDLTATSWRVFLPLVLEIRD